MPQRFVYAALQAEKKLAEGEGRCFAALTMDRKLVAERLRTMEQTRKELKALETALGELNPEERLVAEFLLVSPERGNVRRLCEILNVEQASIYRKKARVLKKLAELS